MIHPLLSLQARVQSWKAEHFEKTRDGRRLARLKDLHAGRRCFIIGNGPSLTAEDLDALAAHGEITFAFNRIYHIFDQTRWRPTYYISQDEKMLAGCAGEVTDLAAEIKFIPAEAKWYHGIEIPGCQLFHLIGQKKGMEPVFSENIPHGISNSNTVVFSAMQFAVYMGIREIYLIGVDHHFHTSVNDKGEIVVDPTAKDYFSDKYNPDKDKLYIPNTDASTLTYIAAKRYADTHGVRVCNATRGGKLEVFERVDLDSLFQ